VVVIVGLTFSDAAGAGFLIFTHGARATAMGEALAARGGDPSAVLYNPAGIAALKGTQLYFGTTLIMPISRFAGIDPAPGFGVTEEQKRNVFFPSTFYITRQLAEKLTVGFGFFSPYGLGTEWKNPDTYSGRYLAQKTDLKSFYFNPVAAYQIHPRVSVAAGAQAVLSTVELRRAIPQVFLDRVYDVGKVKLSATSDVAFGFNGGLLVRPTEKISVGVSYRSQVKMDYDGDADFTSKATGNPLVDAAVATEFPKDQKGTTQITFPQIITGAVGFTPSKKWSVEFDVSWVEWSKFDRLELKFPENPELSQTIPEDYEDSFTYRVGGEYKLTDKLTLRAGYIFDQTPSPDESVTPLLADADRHDITAGLGYTFGKVTVDLAHMLTLFKKRKTEVNRDNYNGEYRTIASLPAVSVRVNF